MDRSFRPVREDDDGHGGRRREVAVAGTYQEVPKVDEEGNDMRQGLGAILMAPTRGIQAASDVVAFVLLIGGSFAILTKRMPSMRA